MAESDKTKQRSGKKTFVAWVAVIATLLAAFVPYIVGRPDPAGQGKSYLVIYLIGLEVLVGARNDLRQVPQIPCSGPNCLDQPRLVESVAMTSITDPVVLARCTGLEPYLSVRRITVVHIKDGYSLTFEVHNNMKDPIALVKDNIARLDDGQKNDMRYWQATLGPMNCDIDREDCRKSVFPRGTRIEPDRIGSFNYAATGMDNGKPGSAVTFNTNIFFVLKDKDDNATGAKLSFSGVDLPVR